jgi:hypothetical protein
MYGVESDVCESLMREDGGVNTRGHASFACDELELFKHRARFENVGDIHGAESLR